MNCPVCDSVKLREVQKERVMIDICPSCKGVWLDRGELEKLMEDIREVREPYNQWAEEQDRREEYKHAYEERSEYNRNDSQYPSKKYKKKRSVMDVFENLFD